jgi:hypothetical protein
MGHVLWRNTPGFSNFAIVDRSQGVILKIVVLLKSLSLPVERYDDCDKLTLLDDELSFDLTWFDQGRVALEKILDTKSALRYEFKAFILREACCYHICDHQDPDQRQVA